MPVISASGRTRDNIEKRLTWIRFLPSGFWTSGCNLVVVKVYTRPVSETTSSRT